MPQLFEVSEARLLRLLPFVPSLFSNFLKKPKEIASAVPSSRYVIRNILKHIDFENAECIIEYGPGIGNITGALLKRLKPRARLICFETNKKFCRLLGENMRDTRLKIVNDTAKNLEVMGYDGVIIRHKMSGAPHLLAENIKGAVINAGDGCNEHPTQGLLDMFTMKEKKGDLAGKKVVIVGDIAHSRVARSNIWGLNKLGAKVVVVGPPTLIPIGITEMGCEVSYNLEKAISDADFINVLRIQLERQEEGLFPSVEEYHKLYGITVDRLKKCKPDVVVMHPGPINRGVEISSEVADGPYNVILEQVTNGVAVRMAVLFLLLSGKKPMLMKKGL